jgi:ABC-type Fe3+ transport system substrate-binding protein
LLIPNSVGIVRGAPHSEAAEILFGYLLRAQTTDKLIAAHALEGAGAASPTSTGATPSTPSASKTRLTVDWPRLLADLNETTEKLNRIFLR